MGRTCITVREMAEELNVDRSMLHKFIKKHGIETFDSRSMDSRGSLSKTLTAESADRLRQVWSEDGRDYRPRTYLNLKGERVIMELGGADREINQPPDENLHPSQTEPEEETEEEKLHWAQEGFWDAARELTEAWTCLETSKQEYSQAEKEFQEAFRSVTWEPIPAFPIIVGRFVIDRMNEGQLVIKRGYCVPHRH